MPSASHEDTKARRHEALSGVGLAVRRIGVAILLFHLLLALLFSGETVEFHDKTRQDALPEGTHEGSWIPHWLPPSARDIRSRYNIDTNAMVLAFSFDEVDRNNLMTRCEGKTPQPYDLPHPHIADGVLWWPTELGGGNLTVAKNRLRYFRCTERRTFGAGNVVEEHPWLAVRIDRPLAYFWR